MAELNESNAENVNGVLTVTGTVDNDEINTSNQVVRIDIIGNAGDDIIVAGDGDDDIYGGAGQDQIQGGAGDDHITGGSKNASEPDGADIINGEAGDDVIAGGSGDDMLYGAIGADYLYGETGNDYLFGGEGDDYLTGDEGDDELDGGDGNDQLFGGIGADKIDGGNGADYLFGADGDDHLFGGAGDDELDAGTGNDWLYGGDGTDLAVLSFNQASIVDAKRKLNGDVVIKTANETKMLTDIEEVSFSDTGALALDDMVAAVHPDRPYFQAFDGNGGFYRVTPDLYDGPLAFLKYQLFGDVAGNILIGSADNDFLNLLGGDDAAGGGEGNDVLDGGTGSNFLTGNTGADAFFLDGRGGSTTWSTVTDFTADDNVTIWGWKEGVSQLIESIADAGAEGYKGATLHYDLDGNGLIDTSITLTGVTLNDVPEAIKGTVDGNSYLYFSLA